MVRPHSLPVVDVGNLTAVGEFVEVGTSLDTKESVDPHLSELLYGCMARHGIATAQLLVTKGVAIPPETCSKRHRSTMR
jgi:hypothetical protein